MLLLDFVLVSIYTMSTSLQTCNIKLPTDYLAAYSTYSHTVVYVSATRVLSASLRRLDGRTRMAAGNHFAIALHENTYVSMTQCDFYPVPSKNL